VRCAYADGFVSEPHDPVRAALSRTLELLWQDDAGAYALARGRDGAVSTDGLELGTPAHLDLPHLGKRVPARRVELDELLTLPRTAPDGLELGGTATVVLAVLDVARRSVAAGLVHPHLEAADGRWHALWGATLDEHLLDELDALAHAAPGASAGAFDGDTRATVYDLYGCAVDELARRALRSAGVTFSPSRSSGAAELFLAGLAAPAADLPAAAGYAALERRLNAWVDGGLSHRSRAPWNLGVRLDEGDGDTGPGGEPPVVLELWLEAADDPTLALPASLLEDGADAVFGFLRDSDPRRALERRLATIAPILADAGIVLAGDPPTRVELDHEQARAFLHDARPRLEDLGVPLRLPRAWVASSSRVRVNLVATAPASSSGLLTHEAIASFDWRLAIGDVELTEDELRELAAAKEPLIRLRGKWHALRAADVERALRFLDDRGRSAGVVDLVRAVSGLETDEAGVELGDIRLDGALDELLADAGDRRFRPLATPAGMTHDLFPFQERGHGWLRLLGDLQVGGILADDMGLGKTVQAIAVFVSEREEGAAGVGPTLVVSPMSVAQQWTREIGRFAPGLRVHLHHGPSRLAGDRFVEAARASDVVVTSYDVATRDVDLLGQVGWDRLVLDEAQDAKNPRTKRHRALRRLPRRRTVALTGTPIENRLGELWAIMDLVNPGLLGSREAFERTLARPIEARGDAQALERLRSLIGPFVLRRAKDAPEVDLDLPPITITKVPCTLTIEQASVYRATVDRWMPRIARHARTFDRRGAVLAMLGQLKQVCNHPELIAPTGRPLDGRSGKLERLVGLLAIVPEGDRALVFTQYPGFDRLAPHLAARLGREVGFFHGGLSARARDELVSRFESDDGPAVLVVSLRAGGRGLNLPAANHVVHFDRWWNPAVEQQATDRVHRLGQRKPVFVSSLVCTATLEERIDQLLDAKRELAEQVMAGRADDWLAELDLDAIRTAVALAPEAIEEAA
jgi:non-specific serine/threonine protein kinase